MFVNRPWLRFVVEPGAEGGSSSENSGGSTPDPAEGGNENKNESGGESGEDALKARIAELEKDRDTWKGHARTWEERAKKNKAEDGDASEDFEKRLTELEAKLKQKDEELQSSRKAELVTRVAAEFGLSDEDREFLPDSNDEERLRKHAERLATPKPRGAEDPYQGKGRGGSSREAIIKRAQEIK